MHLEEVSNIKIKNIKIKNNKVSIEYIDNFNNEDKIKINYDIYSKFNINKDDEIDVNTWNKLKEENLKEEIKLYLIKEYHLKTISIFELKCKCNKKFKGNEELINSIIDELIKGNLLSDDEFVKEYYSYLNKELYGKYYILNFFKLNEIPKSMVSELDFNDDEELKKAFKYCNKLIKKNKSNFMKLKVKIYSKLLSRGFDQEITMKVLNSLNINEEDEKNALKKDVDKIVAKQLKKSNQIDYKILNKKLISKGYKFADINEAISKLKGERND